MTSRVGNRYARRLRPHRGSKGQALVEYALVLSLVSVVAIAVLGGFGEHVRNIFLTIISSLAAAGHGF